MLTVEQAAELARLRRESGLSPADRDRVEMVALSAAGWSVAQIAAHLGYCAETVRRLFRRFPMAGWKAVRHQAPGPAPDAARRAAVETVVRALLAEERTWTAGQLAEALAERGIDLSARHLRRYLRRLDAGWYRTKRSLKHRQDPVKAAAASTELAFFANGRKRAS